MVVALAQADPMRAYDAMGEVVKLVNGMKSFDFTGTSALRIAGLGNSPRNYFFRTAAAATAFRRRSSRWRARVLTAPCGWRAT